MDREEEREKRAEGVRGEAVEGEDDGEAGGAGILSLGFAWSELEDAGAPCRERSGLRVGDGEGDGEGFGVSCGSIAEMVQKYVIIWRI